MTISLEQAEEIIRGWPHPWPEFLELSQRYKEQRLTCANSDGERQELLANYTTQVRDILRKSSHRFEDTFID